MGWFLIKAKLKLMYQIWKPLDQQVHVEGKNDKFTKYTKDCFYFYLLPHHLPTSKTQLVFEVQ